MLCGQNNLTDAWFGGFTVCCAARGRADASSDARLKADEPAGALAGVPVAVKDNICTPFGRTTCSSNMLKDFRAPYAATVTEKLLAAGAVIFTW